MKLPEHHSVHITHNQHKNYYEPLIEYLKDTRSGVDYTKDMDQEDLNECIKTDSLWEIQIYPRTPISFHWFAASTLERAVELVWEAFKEDRKG